MSLLPKSSSGGISATEWNYVDVQVLDGDRVLHPTHTSFDRLIFAEPPRISSEFLQIIVTNNGQSHSSRARVLAHESTSTDVPIQLIEHEQKASTKLSA